MTPNDKQQKTELAQVLRAADMVGHQAGSVVSRTLVDKTAGTVTLFSFAAGQGLSEHSAPYDALVYVFDGEVEVKISGRPFSLTAGDMIIMPANKPHALKAIKQFKMMLVMIKS